MKTTKVTINGREFVISRDLALRAGLIRPEPENAPCGQIDPFPAHYESRAQSALNAAACILWSAVGFLAALLAGALILWGCL